MAKCRFIEGQGCLVEESKLPKGGTAVNQKPAPGGSGASVSQIRKLAKDAGLLAINPDNLVEEVQALGYVIVTQGQLDEAGHRLNELEQMLDHVANGGDLPEGFLAKAESDPVVESGGETVSPFAESDTSMDAQKWRIQNATSLEGLNVIVEIEEGLKKPRKTILDLADARAEEIKQEG